MAPFWSKKGMSNTTKRKRPIACDAPPLITAQNIADLNAGSAGHAKRLTIVSFFYEWGCLFYE